MKLSLPIYVVSLVATFLYGLLKYYVHTLPFTEEQILYVLVVILTLLNVDVTQAFLRTDAKLKSLLANLKGQKII